MEASLSNALLKLVRCPVTQSSLSPVDAGTLADLNQKISARSLLNRAGQVVELPLESGLVNGDRTLLLPVRNGIVIPVSEQAIDLV